MTTCYNLDNAELFIYSDMHGDTWQIDALQYITGQAYADLADMVGWELAALVRDCWNSTATFPDDLERVSRVLEGTRYRAWVDEVLVEVM